ncbi:MAG: metallophosphoesterase, partial [Desulfobulbaceae bacterium]|nr:metallophosphoesterase [Desulfobulbaceae bacterium]
MGDSVQIPPGSNGVWRVHVKGFEGVILYPALVTPAIVEAGGCLTVIVAVKDDFKNNYNLPSPGKEIEKNALVAQALHAQICLVEWGDAAIFDTSDIQVMIGHYRNIIAQRHMLYSSHSAAIDKYNNKDKNPKGAPYRCWYLGELQETDFPVEGFDGDGNPRKWGVIHRAAAAMHRKAGAGYKHLIQVNFKEFDNAKIAGMYELAYVYFKLYNDETDLALITEDAGTKPPMRPGGVGSVDTVEVAKTEPPQPPMRYSHIDLGYTDPDDDMLTGYFAQPEDLKKRPKLLQEPEIIQVPKITGDRRRFRLYDSARLEEDGQASDADDKGKEYQLAYTSNADGPYLQARHPVCIVDPEKWQGRIGVMGDLHVSSRQALFPLVNAQVIPGADEKDSPYIGKIAHRSLESVESLLQEIGKDSDLLVLAGDLYDHTRNCDPWHYVTNQKEVLADKTKTVKAKMSMSNTGQLWQAMDYRGYENDYDAYPRGIDGLLLFSRILSVYQSGKPVIYISGNHEGYERPFGISPRIVVDNDTFMRTNAGIPSDHNLTIYEAALLYGQASYDLGTNLKDFQLNFKGENLDWLYCLYTPWKDFILSYTVKNKEEAAPVIGKAKPNTDTLYNFVCLGWGNQEDFLKSAASGGGTLPRAPASCDDSQMKLVKWATDSSAKYN